jgi:hypothetical protein
MAYALIHHLPGAAGTEGGFVVPPVETAFDVVAETVTPQI